LRFALDKPRGMALCSIMFMVPHGGGLGTIDRVWVDLWIDVKRIGIVVA
jgi:hypothetical protein